MGDVANDGREAFGAESASDDKTELRLEAFSCFLTTWGCSRASPTGRRPVWWSVWWSSRDAQVLTSRQNCQKVCYNFGIGLKIDSSGDLLVSSGVCWTRDLSQRFLLTRMNLKILTIWSQ